MTELQRLCSEVFADLPSADCAAAINNTITKLKPSERVTSGILMERLGVEVASGIIARIEATIESLNASIAANPTELEARIHRAILNDTLGYLRGNGVDVASPVVQLQINSFVSHGILTQQLADTILSWGVESTYRLADACGLGTGYVVTDADVIRARWQVEMHKRREATVAEMRKRIDQIEASAYNWIEANDGTGTVEQLDAILRGE